MLGQRRCGVEHGVEVGEEALAQRVVLAEMRGEQFEALRHIEIDGRRNVAQVAQRFVDLARQRLAVVDVHRAAGAQHLAEIVVAAEHMAPRQPVDHHRRPRRHERPDMRQHRQVRVQHPVRGDDALRRAGRAGGEQKLRDAVGADLLGSAGERVSRTALEQLGERRGTGHFRGGRADHDFTALHFRNAKRPGEAGSVGGVDQPGIEQIEDVRSLPRSWLTSE